MQLGFGCVKLSTCGTQGEALHLLKTAYESGIRWFDTAPLYGRGYSELLLGKFIRTLTSKDRDELKVVTKYGLGPVVTPGLSPVMALPLNYLRRKLMPQPVARATPGEQVVQKRIVSRNYVEAQLHGSLRRLHLSRLHAYLGHELVPPFIPTEVQAFLTSQLESGVLTHLGFGTSAHSFDYWFHHEQPSLKWDIIQYNVTSGCSPRFAFESRADLIHVHHSIFSGVQTPNEEIISEHARSSPHAVLLFSSSNASRIRRNAQILHSYGAL